MTPTFQLLVDGVDITARIADRLISLTITDEAGLKSDRLEITVDDRDHRLPVPPQEGEIRAWIGYSDHPIFGRAYMGRYTIDEVEFSSGPRSLTVRAKAAELVKGFQRPKTRSWDATTIGTIVERIATEHGFSPRVGEGLAGIAIAHLDQTEESDAAFLNRLARDNDATSKPADGALLFVRRGEARTASGKAIPTLRLAPGDVTTWKVQISERGAYTAVRAYYQDHGAGEKKTVQVGEGNAVFTIRLPYKEEGEARRAADAKLKAFQRGKASLDLTLPGRPDLIAEGKVALTGFRPGVDGLWLVTRVEHALSGAGYTCSVTAEVGGEGVDDGGEGDSE